MSLLHRAGQALEYEEILQLYLVIEKLNLLCIELFSVILSTLNSYLDETIFRKSINSKEQ